MSLSPQEQRILGTIEDHLTRDDPALAGLLSRRSAAVVGRTCLRPAALLGALVGVLVVLVLAYPLAAPGMPAAVGLLTAVLVMPWMVAAAQCSRVRGRRGRAVGRRITATPSRGPPTGRDTTGPRP